MELEGEVCSFPPRVCFLVILVLLSIGPGTARTIGFRLVRRKCSVLPFDDLRPFDRSRLTRRADRPSWYIPRDGYMVAAADGGTFKTKLKGLGGANFDRGAG